jgi:hypothetical protein
MPSRCCAQCGGRQFDIVEVHKSVLKVFDVTGMLGAD